MNTTTLAAHAEYETLRVVQRREVVGITLDGWKVRHVLTVMDFNKPTCTPAPDVQLEEESFPLPARYQAWQDTIQQRKAERADVLREQVQQCLTDYGPLPASHIARHIGQPGAINRVLNVLRDNPDVFIYHGGQFKVWKLAHQSYEPPKLRKPDTPTMLAVRDAIAEHGPQTMAEIAKRLGKAQPTIRQVLRARPEWFCVVGTRKGTGNQPDSNIWGLA